MSPSGPAQASCTCKPGLVSINGNASAGCFAYCSSFSCDRSATCQVTPGGKTRWAQGPRGGHPGRAERVGWVRGGVHPQLRALWGQVGVGQEVGTGPTSCPDRFSAPQLCVQGGPGRGWARLLRTPAPRGAEGQRQCDQDPGTENRPRHAECVAPPLSRLSCRADSADIACFSVQVLWRQSVCGGCTLEVGASPLDPGARIYPRPGSSAP